MSAPLDLSNPQRPVHVGVILVAGVTEILDVAPIDFLSSLSTDTAFDWPEHVVPAELKKQAFDIRFHWVSEAGPGNPINLTAGIKLDPTDSFESCPPLDIVLMGAHHFGYNPSEKELSFIRTSYDQCSAFLTICGGLEAPRQAGILSGKTVTGPRQFLDMWRHMSPDVNMVEKRWVRDGKLWSSGALLNGTDMMAAFAEKIWGKGEEDSLVARIRKLGGWPSRDVDYKDVPWAL